MEIKQMKTQSFKGVEFKVLKGSTHPEYSYNTFELEEHGFRDKYWNIRPGDVVFDIGTSYGSYALTAAALGATVYAFEPEGTVYCDLVSNIQANNWENQCFAANIGLWSEPTSVNMKSYAPHWPAQTITSDYAMDTIDNIVEKNNIQRIDWMKIDVEGAEEHVVKGGLKSIARFLPNLIIECHGFLDAELKNKITALLATIDQYTFKIIDRPPCEMLLANKI